MIDKVFALTSALNAGGTLEHVFSRIPPEAKRRITRHLVVNDGSIDDTEEALDRLRLQYPDMVTLRHPASRGYGATQKTLLACALRLGAQAAAVFQADVRFLPETIPGLLEPLDGGRADLVLGSRALNGGLSKSKVPFRRRLGDRFLTRMECQAFGLKLKDFHSGYLALSRDAILSIPFQQLSDGSAFGLEIILMARLKGLRITEVPIPYCISGEMDRRRSVIAFSVIWAHLRGAYRSLGTDHTRQLK
jgi:glycosyltransferase involved in cell wall biosynthesis